MMMGGESFIIGKLFWMTIKNVNYRVGEIYNKLSKTPLVTCPRSEPCSEWHKQHRVLCLKGNFKRSICSRSSKVCGNMRSYETTC